MVGYLDAWYQGTWHLNTRQGLVHYSNGFVIRTFCLESQFFVRCLELQKKSQTGKSTKVDPETGKATKRAKCESGCSFRKAQNVAAVRDQALLQVQVKQYRVEICQA